MMWEAPVCLKSIASVLLTSRGIPEGAAYPIGAHLVPWKGTSHYSQLTSINTTCTGRPAAGHTITPGRPAFRQRSSSATPWSMSYVGRQATPSCCRPLSLLGHPDPYAKKGHRFQDVRASVRNRRCFTLLGARFGQIMLSQL